MYGASAVFILDSKGKVIISRNYRGDIPMSCSERFAQHVISQEEHLIRPVFGEDGIFYCWIQHRDVYPEVFKAYFKILEEESIRDNFVLTYELLDEVMDDGYPQVTESKVLKEYIKQEPHILLRDLSPPSIGLPSCVTNSVSWRAEGIKHKKNEIFLDVVEKLNLLVSSTGTVLRSEIIGSLKMKSYLSGMPELKLGLNDKSQFEAAAKAGGPQIRGRAVELEDIRFHQCVRLARFENDRSISFIPPDGEFELMSYRLSTQVRPLIWVECTVSDPEKHTTRVDYIVKAKSNFKSRSVANDVEIHIPVPADGDKLTFKASVGTVKYMPDKNVMVWYIKQFQGQHEHIMSATFGLPSICESDCVRVALKRPVSVFFEIPYFTVSSITVRYLKIIEKSGYHALPWVRYITRNGDYQLRIS